MNRINGDHNQSRGLTLLELLLALAVTAIVGLAMTSAMSATARGMTQAGDARSGLQRAHVAFTRLREYTISGLSLLQNDPNRGFVVWLHDESPGGRVNLSEMRAFYFDSAMGTIRAERLRLPQTWTEAMINDYDIGLDPTSDFLTVMSSERARGYTLSETLVDGLAAWSIDTDGASSQSSPRFRLGLTVSTSDGMEEPVLMSFGLINHTMPR